MWDLLLIKIVNIFYNVPYDLNVWAVTKSGQNVEFTNSDVSMVDNYYTLKLDDNMFRIYFNTLETDADVSLWPINEDSVLYVTYKISKDELTLDGTRTVRQFIDQYTTFYNEAQLKFYDDSDNYVEYGTYLYRKTGDEFRKKSKILENGDIEYQIYFENITGDGGTYFNANAAGNYPISDFIFKDTFDSNFEYVQGSLKMEIYYKWNMLDSEELYVSLYYDKPIEGNVIEISADDWLENTELTNNMFHGIPLIDIIHENAYNMGFVITYTLKPKDSLFDDPSISNFLVRNVAEISWIDVVDSDNPKTITLGPVMNSFEYSTGMITKDAQQLKYGDTLSNIIEFTVELNPNLLDVNSSGDYFIVEDDMSENLTLLWSSVKVYKEVNGEYVELNGILKTLNPTTNTLSFTLPDNVKLKLVYRTIVSGSGDVSISNKAKILGFHDSSDSVNTVFSIGSSTSTASGSEVSFYMLKQDLDTNVPLSGAKLALYGRADTNKQGEVPEGVSETILVGDVTLYYYESYVSGADGTSKVGESLLVNGGLYALVEYEAPLEYVLSTEPIPFYFNKLPDGGNAEYDIVLDQSAFVVTNEVYKYLLPETGGNGNLKYLICGFAIMLVAICILIKKRLKATI